MIHSIFSSDLFLITATVGLFCLGSALFRRTRFMLFHPVLLTFLAVMGLLKLLGIDYEQYRNATKLFDFGLGLSVVALGYLMYEQSEHIQGRLLPVIVSTVVGCIVGVGSVIAIALLFGTDHNMITSIAPKSVTVPIALAASEPLGGIVAVTSIVVFCTGIFGSLFGEWILRIAKVTDPMAKGYALGSASHGIGTARAVEIGAIEGALSGVAMALMGLATALVLPLVEKLY